MKQERRVRFIAEKRIWHAAVIALAVFSLTLNVATRYCRVSPCETQAMKSARSHSMDGERQRLLNDCLHWTAPSPTFTFFVPRRVFVRTLPARPVVRFLYAEDCLYNRPPPAAC